MTTTAAVSRLTRHPFFSWPFALFPDVAAKSGGGISTAADVFGATTLIGRHKGNMDMCCSSSGGGTPESRSDPLPPPPLARVDARDQDAVTALAGSFDAVVDATGSPEGLAAACELCRPMG